MSQKQPSDFGYLMVGSVAGKKDLIGFMILACRVAGFTHGQVDRNVNDLLRGVPLFGE